MKKIGIISDTHTHLPEATFDFFKEVDEIWHAGDIGNIELLDRLREFKPVRAVYGNIDGHIIRLDTEEVSLFSIENCKILLMHIGGRPGRYDKKASQLIAQHKPDIFVCGHSHILRIEYDRSKGMLYINPGSAGKQGFHKKITMLRFEINGSKPENLEIYEANRS